MTEYAWNGRLGRYQNTTNGRIVSPRIVRTHVTESLEASKNATDALAEMWDEGVIDAAVWRDSMRDEIKKTYIRQYLRGIGGRGRMTQADWGRVGGMLREQYRYLDRFAEQVASGNLTAGQIKMRNAHIIGVGYDAHDEYGVENYETERILVERKAFRSRMYANSGREAFERAFAAVASRTGSTQERWVLGETEHCPDCQALAALGWVLVGTIKQFPGDGNTQCLTNCKCRKEYK